MHTYNYAINLLYQIFLRPFITFENVDILYHCFINILYVTTNMVTIIIIIATVVSNKIVQRMIIMIHNHTLWLLIFWCFATKGDDTPYTLADVLCGILCYTAWKSIAIFELMVDSVKCLRTKELQLIEKGGSISLCTHIFHTLL